MPTRRLINLAFVALWAMVLQLGLTGPVHADSQTLLNDVFGMYTNTTDAQILESQQRGGISFGSIYVRNRVVRPNLINFDPPDIRGSCQGLDLYGGSFSFINAEQLIASLRAVAGSAVSYAFTLALEGVCPVCMQKIEWLRGKVDEINKMMQDSCTAAQALVDKTGLDEWHDVQMKKSRARQVTGGVEEDINAAYRHSQSLLQKDQSSGVPTSENAVWKAMQKSALGAWFGSYGDTELREVLMSLTGTVLKTTVNNDGVSCFTPPPDSMAEYCVSERPSIINMKTFVEGSRFRPVKLYYCADDTVNCLDVREREIAWRGLKDRVREILFGPGPGYTGGIITKMRDPAGPGFTARENAFITSPPLPILSLLRDSAHDQGTLVSMGEHIEEMVASQIARNLVLEMIGAVAKSFQSAMHSGALEMSAQMKEKLQGVVDDLNNTDREGEQRLTGLLDMLKLGEEGAKRAKQNDPVGTPPTVGTAARK